MGTEPVFDRTFQSRKRLGLNHPFQGCPRQKPFSLIPNLSHHRKHGPAAILPRMGGGEGGILGRDTWDFPNFSPSVSQEILLNASYVILKHKLLQNILSDNSTCRTPDVYGPDCAAPSP